MKKLYYLIVLALILGLVLTGCTLLSNIGQAPATEQSGITYLTKGSSFTVGNDDTVRPNIDGRSNFTVIDTNNPSSALGLLTAFNYYAVNENPFRFVLVDGSDVVQWVSAEITPSNPTPSVQNWVPTPLVYVESGWNLGLYFTLKGTIPFVYGGAPAYYTVGNSGLPVVGKTLSYQGSTNRIYSFVASGNPIEPTVFTILDGPATVDIGTPGDVDEWTITITICPDDLVNLEDVVVQGGIGADLVVTKVNDEFVPLPLEKGNPFSTSIGDDVTLTKKGGKMGATIVTWYIDDFDSTSSCKNLMLTVETGLNPKLKQEFTSEGTHDIDGGFSATYWYGGMEYETPETEPLTVNVIPAP